MLITLSTLASRFLAFWTGRPHAPLLFVLRLFFPFPLSLLSSSSTCSLSSLLLARRENTATAPMVHKGALWREQHIEELNHADVEASFLSSDWCVGEMRGS